MAATAVVELPLVDAGDCDACADRLRAGLAGHRGVVAVVPVQDAVAVRYDPDLCSLDCLGQAASGLRLDLESAYAHRVCRVEGMDCADCAQTIERAVSRMAGVTSVAVSFPAQTMQLEYRPSVADPEGIAALVRRLGFGLDGLGERPAHASRFTWPARAHTTAVATALFLLALAVDLLTGRSAVPLYAAAILAGGLPLARSGVAALVATRRPDINLLMALAAAGAAAIGAWLEASLVVVLFSVGELLERRAVDRARRELTGLVSLAPETAHVRRPSAAGPAIETEVPVTDVVMGEAVAVRPGERVPVDGVVRDGASAVDQAPITGESLPVEKKPGDVVFAGTRNGHGFLLVEVTSAPGDTTLDRVRRLVAEAQARKSPSERWVDSFARWYTPAVVGLAVLVAGIPPLFGVAFATSFYNALALLILACPCALVISTPVAIASALGRSSAAGVLVKGGAHLEQAAAITSVAFDKTGTLTEGRPAVVVVEPLATDAEMVLVLAASVEQASEHPLARSIVHAAVERDLRLRPVTEFEALTGLGVRGKVDGFQVTVGDPRLFSLHDELCDTIRRLHDEGRTVVVVEREGVVAGLLGLADTVRAEAREAIVGLRRLGVFPIFLLTGDNEAAAGVVAAEVGIDTVRSGLLPGDKATVVDELGREAPGAGPERALAMVGDGVNDAPALAAADLGLAMGSAGNDTAISVADAAIMGDDLRKVAGLIGLARWTRAVVRQNIAFSLGTKLGAAGILLAGALPLWGAVVADVGASLIVIANGLRLVRGRPRGRLRGMPILR